MKTSIAAYWVKHFITKTLAANFIIAFWIGLCAFVNLTDLIGQSGFNLISFVEGLAFIFLAPLVIAIPIAVWLATEDYYNALTSALAGREASERLEKQREALRNAEKEIKNGIRRGLETEQALSEVSEMLRTTGYWNEYEQQVLRQYAQREKENYDHGWLF